MKLIQAVKMITDAGLSAELRCRTDAVGKEVLTLFGMGRWHRETRYSDCRAARVGRAQLFAVEQPIGHQVALLFDVI